MSENAALVEDLSREQLYEKVWSQPMTKTAKLSAASKAGPDELP